MKAWQNIVAASLWLLATVAAAQDAQVAAAPGAGGEVGVVLFTTQGNIHLAVDTRRAPVTAANFLRYVDAGRFDGITFYRAIAIGDEAEYGLVQGGLRSHPSQLYEPIAHESTAQTGLSHVDGALSMAHLEPGSATADFFIVVGNLVSLDGDPAKDDPGYAVFGRVTDGMAIVRRILVMPRDPEAGDEGMKGQMLAEPVQIVMARREGGAP